jgi:hypothetical protein
MDKVHLVKDVKEHKAIIYSFQDGTLTESRANFKMYMRLGTYVIIELLTMSWK